MIEVTKEQFYRAIGGPENIHPRSEREFTVWEVLHSRHVVGRSEPGYLEPGRQKRYWLARDFAARKGLSAPLSQR